MTVSEWTQNRWAGINRHWGTALLACVVSVLALNAPVAAQPAERHALDPQEKAIAAWIDDNTDSAVELLEKLVNISSGTMNHKGVQQVGAALRQELDELGLTTEGSSFPKN